MNTQKLNIPKFLFSEPIRNLPTYKVRNAESRFVFSFARVYLDEFFRKQKYYFKNKKLVVAREIPANGYGIADLVAVRWSDCLKRTAFLPEEFSSRQNSHTIAFELKLKDWRNALLQANRYRFFSNQAVVVLPSDAVHNALRFIETFRLLNVGLWSFDSKVLRISRHYTPRTKIPVDKRERIKVIEKVAKATKALPI